MLALLFILFAGLAIGCAISVVAQRNPLYSAISLIGVFISLACLYVTLAAPFIAAVQVIVYAGAIMVLVVFVIMLLNVDEEERRPARLRSLVPIAVGLAAILFAETVFIIFFVQTSPQTPTGNISDVGLTSSIGAGLFTTYLLALRDHFDPFVDGGGRRDDAGATWRIIGTKRRRCSRLSELCERYSGPVDHARLNPG